MRTATTIFTGLLLLVAVLLPEGECHYRAKRIVGGTTAKPPPVDDPVVFVSKDDQEARIYGTRDPQTGYYLFRGIRYAEPPVGNRRFRRSVPMGMDGELNATEWGSPCPQPGENGGVIGSEDCLFLNVFTPALPDATDGYPVVIWVHGGGFRRGAATQYEMRQLIEKKIIVVSVQYRLGSLGFLSSNNRDLSGNNGLFDLIQATEWVRDYIEFFGGNPKKITAFGQGTGASAAFMMGLSKFGNTYYSGIIAMSGSHLSRFAVDKEPTKSSEMLANATGCPFNETVALVACLRAVPTEKIIEHDNEQEAKGKQAADFVTDMSSLMNSGPVIEGKNDGRSLPNFNQDQPEMTLDQSNFDEVPDIPLLTGVVKDETGGAVHGPFKDTITNTLNTIPNFLSKNLIPQLQGIVPSIGTITKQFVPEAFNKYLTLNPLALASGQSRNAGNAAKAAVDNIAKVAEVLNDAIFNVPAFLTAKNWAKKNKAYMYSFDHQSKQGFGKDFLKGSPLVGNSAETGKTSHGDDLGYLFEPNTIMGKPMPPKELDADDMMVRDVMTNMVAEFARNGNLGGEGGRARRAANSKSGSLLPFSVPSFTGSGGDDDGFFSISSKPKVSKGFRFCEMGLWAGIGERFKSAACNAFQVDINSQLKTIEKSFGDITANLPTLPKVGDVSEFLDVDGLLAKPDLPIKAPTIPSLGELPKVDSVIPGGILKPSIPGFSGNKNGRPTTSGRPSFTRPTAPANKQPTFPSRVGAPNLGLPKNPLFG